MPIKNMNINIAYHFMAEAMIIFLIAIPFTYGEYHQVPYWGYLGMTFGMCFIYSLYTTGEKSLGWYIATVPVFIVLFFVADYPFI